MFPLSLYTAAEKYSHGNEILILTQLDYVMDCLFRLKTLIED